MSKEKKKNSPKDEDTRKSQESNHKNSRVTKKENSTKFQKENSTKFQKENSTKFQKENFVPIVIQDTKKLDLNSHKDLSEEEEKYYQGLLEALIFLSSEPPSLSILAKNCQLDRSNTRAILDKLIDQYEERNGGFVLREIATTYQFISSERYSKFMLEYYKEQKKEKLSKATLETLAIICYNQPITLPEIEEIRGSASRTMLSTLLQRKLIKNPRPSFCSRSS